MGGTLWPNDPPKSLGPWTISIGNSLQHYDQFKTRIKKHYIIYYIQILYKVQS